jgi:hypothetical protein
MDVKNMFLQGTLEEEVYMTLPFGHKKEGISNLVCRLKKNRYMDYLQENGIANSLIS